MVKQTQTIKPRSIADNAGAILLRPVKLDVCQTGLPYSGLQGAQISKSF